MEVIQKVCNKVVWLEHGTIKQFGPPERVVQAYESFMAMQGLSGQEQTKLGCCPTRERLLLMPDAEGHPALRA